MYIAKIVNDIFQLYFILLVLRIFLTWIPSINWYNQPFKAVREVCDLYLDIFRKFIPPIGAIDFSPIIALIVLQMIQVAVTNVIAAIVY